jgi:hypothetical protein
VDLWVDLEVDLVVDLSEDPVEDLLHRSLLEGQSVVSSLDP